MNEKLRTCANSYGIEDMMIDCIHGIESCYNCQRYERRPIAQNEDDFSII